jgi:hypothetical protein
VQGFVRRRPVAGQSSFGLDWQGKLSKLVESPKAVVAVAGLDFVEQLLRVEVPFVGYDGVFQFLVAF